MSRLKDVLVSAAAVTLLAGPLEAVVVPSRAQEKEFRSPGLFIPTQHTALSALDAKLAAGFQGELAGLGVPPEGAFYDPLWQRWGSLLPSQPLLPGRGVGNTLSWANFGVAGNPTDAQIKTAAWEALTGYLQGAQALRVDVNELSRSPRLAVHDGGALIQIHAQRFLAGVPVRDSSLTAVINNGNLVLLGLHNWGDAAPVADPGVTADDARTVVSSHAAPAVLTHLRRPRLEFVPFAAAAGAAAADGYGYRLVWVVDASSDGDQGTWEGLVDARTGELLAFQDKNQYDKTVKRLQGGVFPVSNDQVPPDGVEQPGFPMPFADIRFPDNSTTVTNTGGVIGCVGPAVSGPQIATFIETTLSGPYVRIADVCGPVLERFRIDSLSDAADLGSGPGTDCVVPAGRHSAGDTHSSRTAFYEVNKLAEQARGYLPNNQWLRAPLLTNLNINNTCNAFWSGSSINFYRDNGSACRNTGEIAAIFDHEWGHGMDNNGVNPNIANPGEGIADIHAIYRLNDSCMARGFRKVGNCGGYGDPCLACSGIREIDWNKRVSQQPHGLPWIDANCGSGPAPCGGGVHCEGAVYGESAWDLFTRDFRGFGGSVFNFDLNTALELSTRLFYLGSGPVVQWFQCTNPNGGCLATGGYMNILAVDDDNGNINDGTPHMTAIFAAFNRHNIACATPVAVNSGCVGGPAIAPVLTATARDQGANLSWTAVPGASRYAVFRTEGVRGCDFGKAKIGETTGLTFEDGDVRNGFGYYYSILPIGSNTSCFGLMSNCQQVTPAPGPNVRTLPPSSIQVIGGDSDGILDNCETARLTVNVENNGVAPLTNVRVIAASSSTHPLTVPTTPLPHTIAASLVPCATASATFDVQPHGMTFNQTFEVTLTITADQIAPSTRTVTFRATGVESDFTSVATRTYNFNAGMDGWTVNSGTFNRVDGGGGNFFLASSNCLDDQCDVVRSPTIRLTGTSTLSLTQRYDTETPTPIPYDRANVGIFDVAADTRTPVSPNGGDPYDLNTGAANGTCGTALQAGWSADSDADCVANAPFLPSSWTSAALNPSGQFTGISAQLSVNYGTDPAAFGWGFHFDDVVLTNFQEAVPDAQACPVPPPDFRTTAKPRQSLGRR